MPVLGRAELVEVWARVIGTEVYDVAGQQTIGALIKNEVFDDVRVIVHTKKYGICVIDTAWWWTDPISEVDGIETMFDHCVDYDHAVALAVLAPKE